MPSSFLMGMLAFIVPGYWSFSISRFSYGRAILRRDIRPISLMGVSSESKFSALMAAEPVQRALPLDTKPLEWQSSDIMIVDPDGRSSWNGAEWTSEVVDPSIKATSIASSTPSRELALLRQLFSEDELAAVLSRALQELTGSADGELNYAGRATHAHVVIENGKVVCPEMAALLAPALEERLLPYVRKRYGAPRAVVADALVRAYRPEDRRQSLAPHFDLSAFVTAIVPLNPGEYEGRLFIQAGASANDRAVVDSHFGAGDVLIHRYERETFCVPVFYRTT